MSGPLDFGQVTTPWQQEIRNFGLRSEKEPECGEYRYLFFFGFYPNLGTKFRRETELFSLTKLRKNILPPRNLLRLINKKRRLCNPLF